MKHSHPRGQPVTNPNDFCKACVTQGITTAQESEYVPPLNRGHIRVGMTVTWMEYFRDEDSDKGRLEQLTGQVWSRAEDRITHWTYAKDRWFVVTPDGKSWKVKTDDMEIIKEKATV